VKVNYLPTTLFGAARSWLINLPEGSIYTWDQLCTMFIGNFQGTYKHPSTAETLKTIRQKHDESLWDYVKCFCNAKNAIPYIQDIEIINVFCDGVSDIKTVEEIAMKKPNMVADLLTVTNTCIEASKARARLPESRGKGPAKKQDDQEVNTTDRGDHKDHGDRGYHRNHQQQSSDQKEKRPFCHPDDTKKWCEIHRTSAHNLEECKTFLDRKKMPPPAMSVAQEPRHGDHCRTNPSDDDEQIGEINVIFRGSMSIASKTQGKKFEREISLAQRIELDRMMRSSDMDISFGP
jgi:hypothetical protein